jgi:hypothetical protein
VPIRLSLAIDRGKDQQRCEPFRGISLTNRGFDLIVTSAADYFIARKLEMSANCRKSRENAGGSLSTRP